MLAGFQPAGPHHHTARCTVPRRASPPPPPLACTPQLLICKSTRCSGIPTSGRWIVPSPPIHGACRYGNSISLPSWALLATRFQAQARPPQFPPFFGSMQAAYLVPSMSGFEWSDSSAMTRSRPADRVGLEGGPSWDRRRHHVTRAKWGLVQKGRDIGVLRR